MRAYLEYNFRRVDKIEMNNLLDSIEDAYLTDMKSSFASFDTYNEVSDETFNDYRVAVGKLELLNEIGILTPTECKDLCEEANAMRLKFLNENTKQGGK